MAIEDQVCPRCGQQLPKDARTRGLCPWCLLHSALDLGDAAHTPEQRFVAPDPRELADEFPDIEVLELLAQGGMAAVYKARQRSLDRVTAIKVFPRQVTGDPAFAERFRHEARTLAKLNHPHIVAAYEFGQSDRYCYFLMEFIDGITLRQALRSKPLSARDAMAIAYQVCEALAFAHDKGVVHRDIKPENILFEGDPDSPMTESGRVRVADFGLAKLLRGQALDFTLTGSAQMLGTVHYMAPEQTESPRQVDHRADIYAVGVMLYEMLTGELPIGRFAPPSKLADVGDQIDALVLRCLEKSPADRFQTADELLRALSELIPSATLTRPVRRARRPAKKRMRSAAIVALGLAVVAAVLAAVLVPWRSLFPTRPPQPQTRAAYPPRAFVPYDHMHGPKFKAFREGRAKWLKAADAKYGAHRIAAVWVHNMPGEVVTFIHDKVLAASGAQTRDSISSYNFTSINIMIAPVDDLGATAAKIDFGKVTGIDREGRVITIEADPARLPAPLKGEVTDPNSPDFYRRNLEDLGSWDRNRRWATVTRIQQAQPRQLRKEMAAAMERLLQDPLLQIRYLAADALSSWGSAENVPGLIDALKDKKDDVRRRVMTTLAGFKDERAARPVAALLATDSEHAGKCLRRMGPVAEDAVLDVLATGKGPLRLEAVKILTVIGTAKSVPALKALADGKDAGLAEAARQAIEAIERRLGAEVAKK